MSKITFRADDDLVDRLEAFEASKSEVMREALRQYLDGAERDTQVRPMGTVANSSDGDSTGGLIDDRINRLVTERVDSALDDRRGNPDTGTDVSVTIAVEDATTAASVTEHSAERKTDAEKAEPQSESRHTDDTHTCTQCGEHVDNEHVYCPNCGEKASQRLFCECGNELRSDWAFCPGCGRRTTAADVLDNG